MSRLQDQHPRHLQTHRSRARRPQGRGAAQLRQRKATVTRPEIYLHYGEQLLPRLHLPPRHSDKLRQLADQFFTPNGMWKGGERYDQLIAVVETVPEQVTIFSDAMEFMEREIERREMAKREKERLAELDRGELQLPLLKVPLYPYQMRGRCSRPTVAAAFSATTWAWARQCRRWPGGAAGPRTRHRARAGGGPGVGEVSVGNGDSQVHRA